MKKYLAIASLLFATTLTPALAFAQTTPAPSAATAGQDDNTTAPVPVTPSNRKSKGDKAARKARKEKRAAKRAARSKKKAADNTSAPPSAE